MRDIYEGKTGCNSRSSHDDNCHVHTRNGVYPNHSMNQTNTSHQLSNHNYNIYLEAFGDRDCSDNEIYPPTLGSGQNVRDQNS